MDSNQFQLYLINSNLNPKYSPEIFIKLTVVNFGISAMALEDQMLTQIIQIENPSLEFKKIELLNLNMEDKKVLYHIQERILQLLSSNTV